MTDPEPTDDELAPVLAAVQAADEADVPLDNDGIARAVGISLTDVARYLDLAKERSLIWGIRSGQRPAPWFTELELTVQGRRFLAGRSSP